MSLRSSALVALAVGFVALVAATPAEGQIFRYMAFGDSITEGRPEHDPTGQGGYPGRLDDDLGCMPPNCEVINEGKSGEKTSAGVTRIETLLNADDWDVVLLMEGTNDVFNDISNNTIEANLTLMDTKARDHGVDTVHASIIHLDPDSTGGMDSGKVNAVANLRTRIQNLAAARNRYFADPWTPLCPNQACFNQHYHDPPGAVGHPDPSGFDILSDEFADTIQQRPLPGPPIAVAPTGTVADSTPDFTWNKEAPADATWYQFRLLNAAQSVLHDQRYEETAVCPTSQCSLNLGSFADGDYTWEVRGRSPRGRSAWVSTPFTIDTLVPPTLPTPQEPVGYIVETEPSFVWKREIPANAESYRLKVSDTGGVIHDVVYPVTGNCIFDTCTVEPFSGTPLAPGDYTYRLQGENAAGTGPWTANADFTVEPDLIFWDGFESGDTEAWDTVVP